MGEGIALPKSFRILLRSPQDLVVVRMPSWWTPSHLLEVLGLVLGVTLAVLVWVFVLRHRVKRQTRVIRNQLALSAQSRIRISKRGDSSPSPGETAFPPACLPESDA